MHTESRGAGAADGARLERAIVLTLLGGDPERAWAREELAAELGAVAGALDQALARLAAEEVVCSSHGAITAARAARRLDELGLIAL